MRRLVIYLFCLFPLLAMADNTLSLSAVFGHPGDTLTVTATLTNTDAVAALQADIPLSAHVRFLEGSALMASSRSNGHTLYAAAANDTLHVTIISLTNSTLLGAEGELFSFRVVLGNEPVTYPLAPIVTLGGANAQTLATNVAAGSVTLLSPKIQIGTTTLNYGHIPIRSTYTQTLTVRNIGNEPLHITNMEFSVAEFSVEQPTYTIAAGASQNITIHYAPENHGAISETVRLRSDAINDANVYGANLAQLIADPFSVNELRVQPVSGISDDTVSVTLRMNNMETDLTGVQVSFKLPQQLEFIEGSATPLIRANMLSAVSTMAGDTLTLMLYSFTNSAIEDVDGDLLTFRLRLNGRSGSYRLQPFNTVLSNATGHNMVSAVYQANVTIQSPTISSASSLALGSIPITLRDTVAYSVRNTGQAPLTIDKVTFLQEGFRVITPLPITIARNASATLDVEYAPSVEGTVSTLMQVYSNDPATRMKSVSVSAQVFEPNILSFQSAQQSGGCYLLPISMDNYTPIAGIQFDIICPDGLTPQSFIPSAHLQDFSYVMQAIGDNTWRVVIYTVSGVKIERGNATIGFISFSATEAASHISEIVSLSEIVLGDAKSNNRFTGTAPKHAIQDVTTTAIGVTHNESLENQKVFENGQLYILLPDGTRYSATGQKVE